MYRNSETDNFGDMMALLGRILMVVLFVWSGWGKLTNFSGTVGYITKANVPMPEVAAAVGIVVELVLALMLLIGWQTRWVALGIAIYTLVVTPIFHAYWSMPQAQQYGQMLNFYKNLSIAGGLLAFVAFGPGRFSVDARTAQRAGGMQAA